jgi:hypothetical protein
VYGFVLRWLAHVLQNPSRKPRVALLFHGRQGISKTTLAELVLKRVIGQDYVAEVEDGSSLTGPFNAHRANKLLIVANELRSGGAACKQAHVLKSMIPTTAADSVLTPPT